MGKAPSTPSAHPPWSLGQGESNCKVNLALWESASLWEHVELSFGEEGKLLADQLGGSLAPRLLLQLQALGGVQQAVDLHSEVLNLCVLGLQCKLPTAHRTSQVAHQDSGIDTVLVQPSTRHTPRKETLAAQARTQPTSTRGMRQVPAQQRSWQEPAPNPPTDQAPTHQRLLHMSSCACAMPRASASSPCQCASLPCASTSSALSLRSSAAKAAASGVHAFWR